MSRILVALGCLFAVVASAGCNLNPQVEPPLATAENNRDGGSPIFVGGMGGAAGAQNYGTGGRASTGGAPGAGGTASQGGSSGGRGVDGGTLVDGATPGEAGTDAGPDGAPRSDAGTDGAPKSDASPTKDARAD